MPRFFHLIRRYYDKLLEILLRIAFETLHRFKQLYNWTNLPISEVRLKLYEND